jgi:hypothetical protein
VDDIRGTFLGQVQTRINQSFAAFTGIGQEVTDLAIVDFAKSAAPLASDATGVVSLFGDGMAIQDQNRLGVGDVVTDVAAQFGADGAIIPESSANEVLQGSPFEARLGGDRFGGFAFQAGEFALEDGQGMATLFLALEKGEVALNKDSQALEAGGEVVRGNLGGVEEGLSSGMFQNSGHALTPSG